MRQAPCKGESTTVIFHNKRPVLTIRAKPNQHLSRAAVFANIYQTLLHDAGYFAAHLLRHIDLVELRKEACRDSRFSLKPLHRICEETKKPSRVDVERLHLLHKLPELQHLFAQQSLDAAQLLRDRSRLASGAPQDINLHFHRYQGLHSAVM